MNRLFILCAVWLAFSSSGEAQFFAGPKAGMNLAHWSTDGHNSITTFYFGATARFAFSEEWSASAELLYEKKGSDLNEFIPGVPMAFTQHYLSVPILLNFHLRRVSFSVGQEVSYLVGSRVVINDMEQHVPDAFSKWDWGVAAGAAFQITEGLAFEVRYVFGLLDGVELHFVDENGQDLGRLEESKNRVLQLGMRYEF